ncbi:hypothetical protein NMY22_g394 [Coprinellus aureogranulatus]|nr:hypothetical protein NMY22_g394 [Coprinellus aureogranulatus]
MFGTSRESERELERRSGIAYDTPHFRVSRKGSEILRARLDAQGFKPLEPRTADLQAHRLTIGSSTMRKAALQRPQLNSPRMTGRFALPLLQQASTPKESSKQNSVWGQPDELRLFGTFTLHFLSRATETPNAGAEQALVVPTSPLQHPVSSTPMSPLAGPIFSPVTLADCKIREEVWELSGRRYGGVRRSQARTTDRADAAREIVKIRYSPCLIGFRLPNPPCLKSAAEQGLSAQALLRPGSTACGMSTRRSYSVLLLGALEVPSHHFILTPVAFPSLSKDPGAFCTRDYDPLIQADFAQPCQTSILNAAWAPYGHSRVIVDSHLECIPTISCGFNETLA